MYCTQVEGGSTELLINISGLTSQPHALHVHTFGDVANGCTSTGEHYNPFGTPHGSPLDHPALRHFGDLGNVKGNSQGRVKVKIEDQLISLLGPFSSLGRAMVVSLLLLNWFYFYRAFYDISGCRFTNWQTISERKKHKKV